MSVVLKLITNLNSAQHVLSLILRRPLLCHREQPVKNQGGVLKQNKDLDVLMEVKSLLDLLKTP